jgi:hypothetical protein
MLFDDKKTLKQINRINERGRLREDRWKDVFEKKPEIATKIYNNTSSLNKLYFRYVNNNSSKAYCAARDLKVKLREDRWKTVFEKKPEIATEIYTTLPSLNSIKDICYSNNSSIAYRSARDFLLN